jgi:1,4-dihydroxy-2-naphthoate octaprenyltransferase
LNQIKLWVLGARPKTLFAAVSPILTASFYAVYLEKFSIVLTILALIVALTLQVGVNYANDYSDGIRGTDKNRVGPIRLVGQNLIKASNVKYAAFVAFALSALTGLIITVLVGEYWLVLVGLSAILAGWFYTGGKRPYGYAGLGEIFVFIYFGLVATMGTIYLQTKEFTITSFVLGSIMGTFAVIILLANNLRDLAKDAQSDKLTLAVKLGDRNTRILILLLMVKAYLNLAFLIFYFDVNVVVAVFSIVLLIQPASQIISGKKERDLISVLVKTSQAQLVFSVLLLVSLFF